MVGQDMFMTSEMQYDPASHVYKNLQGEQYTSVTRLIKSVVVPFDDQMIAGRMAQSVAEETGISVEQAKQEILDQWKETRDSSLKRGDYVHDALDRYAITGQYDTEMQKPILFLVDLIKQYYRYHNEQMIYSHTYKVAGRADMILQRQKSKNPVFDLMDYKSNESKGIQFDSIGRKNIDLKHYNRYFLSPLDYLEDCNYTQYCLQLSIYAFLMLEHLKVRIGKLWILFVDNDFEPHYFPVPFMYQEAKLLCETNITRKPLPTIISTFPENSITDMTEMSKKERDEFIVKEEW